MLIAHISDPHITTGPLAAGPAFGLHQALGRLAGLTRRPDCVVVTGDLVDRGEPAEYAALRTLLARTKLPIHLVPGNHDERGAMLAAFGGDPLINGGTDRLHYTVDYPAATICVLDSMQPGTAAGHLDADQLTWLDGELARRPDVPAFVCLHHPPLPVGLPFMDTIKLANGPDLAAVLRRHRNVVRVLTGHLHRTVTASFAGTVLTGAPSTYRQVHLGLAPDPADPAAPPAEPFAYAHEPTGGLLHLLTDGDCVTHSLPISHAVPPLPPG